MRAVFAFGAMAIALSQPAMTFAQALPPPAATDPVKLGIMVGSPPPAERRVTKATVLKYPNARWAFHNMRALYPTHAVPAAGVPIPLRESRIKLSDFPFSFGAGNSSTFTRWQEDTYTDAMIVLYKGQVVYERYASGMDAAQPHALWSMSKSILGTLALLEIDAGRLDPSAKVGALVPELSSSAWSAVTVQQLLDMQSGVDYRESFSDRQSDLYKYLFATGLIDTPPGVTAAGALTDYLPTVRPGAATGTTFSYKSVDSEVLGWVLTRTTGRPISALVAERLWRPLGAESDGYYLIDPAGTDIASVGLNATLRDMARLGEALANHGSIGGRRVFAGGFAARIGAGVDRTIFAASPQGAIRKGYGYRNQWWIPESADGVFEAKGLFGQHLYVNTQKHIVIVKFSSHPVGDTSFTHAIDQAAFDAVAARLDRQKAKSR